MGSEDISIRLSGNTILLSEIDTIDMNNLTHHERQVILFCRDWKRGKTDFEKKTSGSTGPPKSIPITRAQMVASARLTQQALGMAKGMTSLICLDTNYIGGQMMVCRSLLVGMDMIVQDPSANPLLSIGSQHIDFAAMVPYQVQSIIHSASRSKLNQMGGILIGGGNVSAALEHELQDFSCRFYSTYGMTETVSHIALRLLNTADKKNYFTALDGVRLSTDERGCLVIQADYLGESPVITNDLVTLLSPSEFQWVGRIDHVINTGGIKVSPEKVESYVENLFNTYHISNRFFVHGFPHKNFINQVALVVEGAALPQKLENDLVHTLKESLPKYEAPKAVVYVEKFVEAANGKINRPATAALAIPLPLSK